MSKKVEGDVAVTEKPAQKPVLECLVNTDMQLARAGVFMDALYAAIGLPISDELLKRAAEAASKFVKEKYPSYVTEHSGAVDGPANAISDVPPADPVCR